jgi:hypothetical protein
MGDVQARPEPDFEHLASQPHRDPGPQPGKLLATQGKIYEPGKDLISVEAHPASLAWPGGCIMALRHTSGDR